MPNDRISDFITRIRNAILVRHKIVKTPFTKLTISITEILKVEGFIEGFETIENKKEKYLLIFLKYKNRGRTPIITFLKRISKPGRRIYLNTKNLPKTIGNYGIAILSTSNGIISTKTARLAKVGGEVLFYIS
uniref:ribosomal protein S8 n=1 Tax=Vacuolaria virescens TaxID=44451 RepID=UPI0021153C2D|nr:ribosomal protein S8 [Vacuolaria virescens]UTE94629.1 ribosomal protein S8 [Vacuolaria virescens]